MSATAPAAPPAQTRGPRFVRSDWIVIGLSMAFLVLAGFAHFAGNLGVFAFLTAAGP